MRTTRRWILALTALTGLSCLAGAARADGSIEAGRRLAIKHCSRCHAVPGHNPHGGIGNAPSFQVLTRIGNHVARMQTFFVRRPHRAFVRLEGITQDEPDPVYATPIRLKVEDVDDLVAYVKSIHSN